MNARKATWYEGGHNGRPEKPISNAGRQLLEDEGNQ